MTDIPVISSILSPEHLAKFVSEKYNIDSAAKGSVLKTGVNHSYLITTINKKYVLRVYFKKWRTEEEIVEELKLLDYLKENKVSISFPIKGKDKNYIQNVNAPEGKRYSVLFSFAEGETIRIPTQKVCYELGVAIAKLHQSTINKTINREDYNAQTLVGWAFDMAKTHFSESLNEMQYFKRAKSIIFSEFEKADLNNLRKGVIHLDLWYENMKVKDKNKFTFFDFDNCGNGWLFLDIAYSLMLIFRNEPSKENFEEKRRSFYLGYESLTPISSEEKRLIPYGGLAIWLHYTGIQVQRFNDFSNHFLSEEFLKYWIHTVNQWMKYNNIDV